MNSAEQAIKPQEITIAVEGWNAHDIDSRQAFESSLASLQRQTFPVEQCRVIVIIDASVADEDLRWISQAWPSAEVVALEQASYYRTKNHALEIADTPYLVLADSDVIYDQTWLENMLASMKPGVPFVVGDTMYAPGFLHRTLDLCDWVSLQERSGFTKSFYANNLVLPRSTYRELRFRTDFGNSGGGGADVLRSQLVSQGILPWYCAEARGTHDLPDFFYKRFRVGAFQIHYRRLAPEVPWAWLTRLGWFSPPPILLGTLLKAWARTWRFRRKLPLGGWSVPYFLVTIPFIKIFELIGAYMYIFAPEWLNRRARWFAAPTIPSEPAVATSSA